MLVARTSPASAPDHAVVQAVDVVRRYQRAGVVVDAVRGISLSIGRGEVVAITGPSGSGKSTLLHMLGGLDTPDAGSITIAGRALRGMSDRALTVFRRRTVGFVFQSFNLVPTLTSEENVALPLLLDGVATRHARARARAALADVDLLARASHPPERLSGGEAQRVAVARAMVVDPALVLADEPTGSLDSATAMRVLELLSRSARTRNAAVVLVTHDPKAASHAERAIQMVDGTIVEAAPAVSGQR